MAVLVLGRAPSYDQGGTGCFLVIRAHKNELFCLEVWFCACEDFRGS